MCTPVFIGWDPAPPPPRVWAHVRRRFWSVKIDDISLWPPDSSNLWQQEIVTLLCCCTVKNLISSPLTQYLAVELHTEFYKIKNSVKNKYSCDCNYDIIIQNSLLIFNFFIEVGGRGGRGASSLVMQYTVLITVQNLCKKPPPPPPKEDLMGALTLTYAPLYLP